MFQKHHRKFHSNPAKHPNPKVPAAAPARQPGRRGWAGEGGGAMTTFPAPREWRGTSRQVCGLWPFSIGDGTPMDGVPLGDSFTTGASLADDMMTAFELGKIRAAAALILGLNGLGKSKLVHRLCIGQAAFGMLPWFLGDVKGEHAELTNRLEGIVFRMGPGQGGINPLDVGAARAAITALEAAGHHQLAREIRESAHTRRVSILAALISLVRDGAAPEPHETTILGAAIRHLDTHHPGAPVMAELLALVRHPTDGLRTAAVDRGSMDRYREKTEHLEEALVALDAGGQFGDTFAGHTTLTLEMNKPVCFDISGIDDSHPALRAAVMTAIWSYGFGAIDAANALADAGIAPQRNYLIVLDEMWQALRSGAGIVDRLDALTRLNRALGVAQLFITHSISDFYALDNPADIQKAKEFINRSGLLFIGGIPDTELPGLTQVVDLSEQERARLKSWNQPGPYDPATGNYGDPPGRGCFLLKAGSAPGIPFRLRLTPTERTLTDTNARFAHGKPSWPLTPDPEVAP